MRLAEQTKINTLIKHLRENYSLRCLIKGQLKPTYLNTKKKNKPELHINGTLTLKTISLFLKEYNIEVYFTNLKGQQLPDNLSLKDVKKYSPSKKETNEVLKSLKIISSMTNSNVYSEMDWVIRIYERIIGLAETEEEKSEILNSIIQLHNSNERFTDRDKKQLIELIEK